MIELSPDQEAARVKFMDWFNDGLLPIPHQNPRSNIFRIFGYAGTGKTTITKQLVRDISGLVLYGAFTGKAALVMQRHGLPARTVHSLIYKPVLPSKEAADELREDIKAAKKHGIPHHAPDMQALFQRLKEVSTLSFEINDQSILAEVDLFVLDECSMINDEMKSDILSFDVPLLVLGDPGQLPPVELHSPLGGR